MRTSPLIDKLEVTLHAEIPLSIEVEAGLGSAKKMREPKMYQEGFDLAPLGIPATLQRRCFFGATQRLSIKGAGRMTLREMAAVIERVFNADPWKARLARIDMAVDLEGVSIDWIRSHVRVAHKRDCWEERGSTDCGGMSLYVGHTADLFRFYDKLAESLYRNGAPVKVPPVVPLSRIERQLRTARIPARMSTLSGLMQHGLDFNPFSPLRFAEGGKTEPRMRDYAPRDYLSGMGLRGQIYKRGFARFYQDLNECSKGNAQRVMKRLRDFLPSDSEGFCDLDLFTSYRSNLVRQLAESELGKIGSTAKLK